MCTCTHWANNSDTHTSLCGSELQLSSSGCSLKVSLIWQVTVKLHSGKIWCVSLCVWRFRCCFFQFTQGQDAKESRDNQCGDEGTLQSAGNWITHKGMSLLHGKTKCVFSWQANAVPSSASTTSTTRWRWEEAVCARRRALWKISSSTSSEYKSAAASPFQSAHCYLRPLLLISERRCS